MRIVFMGTAEFAVPSIRALHEAVGLSLLVTQPDRPAGRNLKTAFSPAKRAGLELGLEIFQPERIKAEEALARIALVDPDVIWVAAYGQILPLSLLQLPGRGALNLHGSLLPAYRGAAPIQRAIMNGDRQTGVTTLYMTPEVDAGDIVLERPVLINDDDTTETLSRRLAEAGAELVLETTALLHEDRAADLAVPQDDALATYAPMISRDEARIDWKEPAQRLRNRVRAMIPWPVAFTGRQGERLRILRAEIGPSRGGRPGEVMSAGREGITVAAGDGSLLITMLQPENRRCMDAAAFVSGYRPQIGEIWGD